jgi:polyhydroxyalkanoate synthase
MSRSDHIAGNGKLSEPLEDITDALGVSEAVVDTVDPVGLVSAMAMAVGRAALKPESAVLAASYPVRAANAGVRAVAQALGVFKAAPSEQAKDRRFESPAWSANPAFAVLRELYLLNSQMFKQWVAMGDLEESRQSKADFAAGLISDASSPTNFLFTNPKALEKALQTGGLSLVKGLRNFADDLINNDGWPSKVDTRPFELGRNLAATPGKVVFRNELIELIQYEPATEKVHQIPILMCPPWINKYYIMDLAPGKSLVEWAVNHGFTTFAISYRNPDESMADVGFDDYLLKGPKAALDVVTAITGSPTVNTVSVCLGGTLTVALLAYLDAIGQRGLINSSTLLNSLTDHEGAGVLSHVFVDKGTVSGLERKMAGKGFLEASDMSRTFDLLRAKDLVFNYVESGWLLGDSPPAFDLLAWNADSTRMPAKMHSFYLRRFWQDNALAHDELELAGERLFLSKVDVDTYIVAAVEDHIVPWRSSYRTTQLLAADCRFVLSSSGHIAGIVNPPSPKSKLWTNPNLPPEADQWRAEATETRDTWWNDWLAWVTPRSGELGDAPATGSRAYPVLGDAPGTYVKG